MRQFTPNQNPGRNIALDYVKGLLVITMIVFHTFTNFYANPKTILTITKFVSGGFIYLTGFLLGYHYLEKMNSDPIGTKKRLIIRALKLFSLFIIMNIGIFVPSSTQFSLEIVQKLYNHLVIGGGASRFEIILPISYLLLLSPFLLSFNRNQRYIAIFISITIIVMRTLKLIPHSTNLFFMLIGYAGLICSVYLINLDVLRKFGMVSFLIAVLVGFIRFTYDNIIIYIIYIISVLTLFYIFSDAIDKNNIISKMILTIGKYTLFSYIFHVVIIVILYKLFPKKATLLENFFIIVIVSMILYSSLRVLDLSRNKFFWIDRLYRFVFA